MASKAALVVMTPRSVPADILKENAKHYWPEDPRHRRPALADRWRCCLVNPRESREVRKPADHCQRNLRAELCARTSSHSLPRGVRLSASSGDRQYAARRTSAADPASHGDLNLVFQYGLVRTAPAGKPRPRTRCACTIAQSHASPVTCTVVEFVDERVRPASQERSAEPGRPA